MKTKNEGSNIGLYGPNIAVKKETGTRYFCAPIKDGQIVLINSSCVAVVDAEEYTMEKAHWFPQMEESMKKAAIAGEEYIDVSERILALEKELEVLKEQKTQSERAYEKAVSAFQQVEEIYKSSKSVKGDEKYFFSSRLYESETVGDLNKALAIALKSDRPIYFEWEEHCPPRKMRKIISKDELLALAQEWHFRDIECNENEIVYTYVSTPTRFD